MCCTRLAENTVCKNLPSGHHCTTLSGYIFANTRKTCIDNWKKLIKQQYLLHVPSQYGELQPTNSRDWLAGLRHPSKFQRVRVLASLLQTRHSAEVDQTLHDVWPSPGLIYYIYIYIYIFLRAVVS